MKLNASSSGSADKTPTGECPLCYTENPYSVSRCSECNLPLPWAKAEIYEREPCGNCLKCQSENTYTTLNCYSCGARLPWANAVSLTAQQVSAKNGITQMAVASSPSVNGYGAPSPNGGPAHIRPAAFVADVPNQFVDAVSLLCPPLGFVAYVTLLGQLPRQALNAARFAMIGVGLWAVLLLTVFGLPSLKFKRGKSTARTTAPVTTASSDTAGDVYQ